MRPAYFFIISIGLVATLVLLGVLSERRRRKRLAELFASFGAIFEFTKDDVAKTAAYLPFASLSPPLKTGAKGIAWSAALNLDGLPLSMIEHSYTTGSGKSRSTHYTTIVAVRCPRAWSLMTVTREHLFTKIGKALGMKDLDLENPEFNKRWRVVTEDENFALAALSTSVQEMLAHSSIGDMGEEWRFGGGLFAVCVSRRLSPDKIGVLLRRMQAFVAAMEPEMREQIAGSRASNEAGALPIGGDDSELQTS